MHPFEDLKVSTSTYMIHYDPSTSLDLYYLFSNLPTVEEKTRVKKISWIEQEGTILNLKYKREQRGVQFEGETHFPNQITLTMSLKDKNINFFLFKNKIEIRGVKMYNDISDTINLLHVNFKKINYPVPKLNHLESIMININYSFPFKVDRLKLCEFLSDNGFHSYYDPQFDNGTMIKIKNKTNNGNQTIIVFQSGIVLHSGKNITEMKESYNSLYPLVINNKDKLEMKFRID
jgi:hypothetical protein